MIQKIFSKQSRGQSLVFVAVLSVALIGMLALGLDFGYSMYNRRWAQNAADSAALAAARILCTDQTVNRYTNATNEARSYAETYNQVFGTISQTMTQICMYGDANNPAGCPSLQPGEARVVVNIQHPNLVPIGANSINVPATASAGCFAPGAGTGFLPIAWKCKNWVQQPGINPECDLHYIPDGQTHCVYGVDPIYVFIDEEVEYVCQYPPNSKTPTIPGLDCDYNDDGVDDLYPLSTMNDDHGWVWVNLDSKSPSTAELKDIVENGFSGTISIHTWLPNDSGTRSAIWKNIPHRDSAIPVFDLECAGSDPQYNCTPSNQWHSGVDQKILLNAAKNYFHLISFALFHVECSDKANKCTGIKSMGVGKIGPSNGANIIEGCFKRGFIPGLSGRPSDGTNTGIWTIYLTK